ncbi:cation:proton antiporter [Azospirillum sp. TSO22-1]|uniref:cation:proton antiporter domain-containing protein n=1 Tax=Azospirillum sp. TSO22-1 TaxID=716789 RepID=UPI000D61A5BF|nr:cation:proton antiporter [Azospirillum sp. TSO22-1]PWC43559.1 cation:proton antiporter [Azospirillum sp. TSO22-1]
MRVEVTPALLFLVQAILLIAVPFLLWRLSGIRRVAPMVVIQILFGVALGPSLLGWVAPNLWEALFAPKILAPLSGLSWLAVVLFAFLTGLHLDVTEFRGKSRAFVAVSLSSLVVPTLLGTGLGWWIAGALPGMAGPAASPALFAVGFGVCLGVTALPVLGAILREMGLIEQRVGRLALGYAAVNDAALWVLVTAVLAWASGRGGEEVTWVLALGAGYLAVSAFVAKPLLERLFARVAPGDEVGDTAIVLTCAGLLASAAVTEAIGLHYILGAFVAGTVMPKRLAAAVLDRLEHFATLVLLPFFFTLTGLKVTLDLSEPAQWTVFALATLVTIAGKLLGTALPARLSGESWGDSWRLGALMPCKGLMEVIVLTILLDARVLSVGAFSALVLMAIATTALTQPMTLLAGRGAEANRNLGLERRNG